MTLRLADLTLYPDDPETLLHARAAERLGLDASALRAVRPVRKALDARRGVRWVYTVDLDPADASAERLAVEGGAVPVAPMDPLDLTPGRESVRGRVVVIGCGPAGLFGALLLARCGYRPLLIERGAPVAERHRDVARFHTTREPDPESNLLFGAGGAGTYSDGKLHTRTRDIRIQSVIEDLIAAGAPEAIRIDARPHVGTDLLGGVVERLCSEFVRHGGEIRWRTRMTAIETGPDGVRAVVAGGERIETNALLLAPGGSARDTFEFLAACGAPLASKPFQMGLRIEHPRALIDRAIYGRHAGHPALGAADYVLSDGGVAAFCVCPGGVIVASVSEAGGICSNGMSIRARNGEFTNAALVATVTPEVSGGPLDGVAFQRRWEREAFRLAGGDYSGPAQSASDYLSGACRPLTRGTTYPLGVRPCRLEQILPPVVADAIRRALTQFGRRIPGFAGSSGILVGPETRASCPVRIVRDPDSRQSALAGLYPAGEGSGYSSGIMSSAVDGMKSAEAMIHRFAIA